MEGHCTFRGLPTGHPDTRHRKAWMTDQRRKVSPHRGSEDLWNVLSRPEAPSPPRHPEPDHSDPCEFRCQAQPRGPHFLLSALRRGPCINHRTIGRVFHKSCRPPQFGTPRKTRAESRGETRAHWLPGTPPHTSLRQQQTISLS